MVLPNQKEKKEIEEWFVYLRDLICESFENIEKNFQNDLITKKMDNSKRKNGKDLKQMKKEVEEKCLL